MYIVNNLMKDQGSQRPLAGRVVDVYHRGSGCQVKQDQDHTSWEPPCFLSIGLLHFRSTCSIVMPFLKEIFLLVIDVSLIG